MRIIVDVGHPAHVHYFRNAIKRLEIKNHQILVTARDKEVSLYLLDHYQIPYISTGKNSKNKLGKIFSILKNDFSILKAALNFKPDIFVSFFLPFPAHIGYLLRKPVIGFTDTENATINLILTKFFTNIILTPACYRKILGSKQIKFSGYMELCYLHPNYFKPDVSIFNYLGLNVDEKYVILRFVSWTASHDFGHQGITLENKEKIVEKFSKYAKVFISSETDLPANLNKYKFNIPPHMMHDAIYYSSLLYGESATMASEAAVLGTPSIYLDDEGRGYTDEHEKKYGIVFNFSESLEDQDRSIMKGIELLKGQNLKKHYREKSLSIIDQNIDVTSLMVWFIENYPSSKKILKDNPNYQYNFK